MHEAISRATATAAAARHCGPDAVRAHTLHGTSATNGREASPRRAAADRSGRAAGRGCAEDASSRRAGRIGRTRRGRPANWARPRSTRQPWRGGPAVAEIRTVDRTAVWQPAPISGSRAVQRFSQQVARTVTVCGGGAAFRRPRPRASADEPPARMRGFRCVLTVHQRFVEPGGLAWNGSATGGVGKTQGRSGPEGTISQEPSDTEVVARTMAGERAAFAILVRRYAAVARRTAAVLGAGADSDDVVQEAFVKAYRALGGFRDGRGVPAVAVAHRRQRDAERACARAGVADRERMAYVAAAETCSRSWPPRVGSRTARRRTARALEALRRQVLALPDVAASGDRLPVPAGPRRGGDRRRPRGGARHREVAHPSRVAPPPPARRRRARRSARTRCGGAPCLSRPAATRAHHRRPGDRSLRGL